MPHVARDVGNSEPFDESIACPHEVYWSPMLLPAALLRPPGRNFPAALGQPKEYAKCTLTSDHPSHDSPPNARAGEPASLSGHTFPNPKLSPTRITFVAPTARTSCHTNASDAVAGTCALANDRLRPCRASTASGAMDAPRHCTTAAKRPSDAPAYLSVNAGCRFTPMSALNGRAGI